jgi:hypothetical protein
MRSSRVLRFNETVEEFFCLFCESVGSHDEAYWTEDHKRLCEDIANDKDGAANDLEKWNAALQVATHIVLRSEGRASFMGK